MTGQAIPVSHRRGPEGLSGAAGLKWFEESPGETCKMAMSFGRSRNADYSERGVTRFVNRKSCNSISLWHYELGSPGTRFENLAQLLRLCSRILYLIICCRFIAILY